MNIQMMKYPKTSIRFRRVVFKQQIMTDKVNE